MDSDSTESSSPGYKKYFNRDKPDALIPENTRKRYEKRAPE